MGDFNVGKKRIKGLVFFLIAFSIAIFTFSVGKSATDSQKKAYLKYDPGKNKVLNFSKCEGVTLEMIKEALKDQNISIMLIKKQDNSPVKLKTYMQTRGIFIEENMLSGDALTKEDYEGDLNKVIASSIVKDEELNISYYDKEDKLQSKVLEKQGEYYDKEGIILMPFALYKSVNEASNIKDVNQKIVLAGEGEYELSLALKTLEKKAKDVNENNIVTMSDYTVFNSSKESSLIKAVLFLIVCVTMINSAGISTIWVQERKKEIIMRKIMGATDKDIAKLFFGELIAVSALSIVIALLVQFILVLLTGGKLLNFDITMHVGNIIYSILITIVMALVVALPFYSDLKEIQPIEILREE